MSRVAAYLMGTSRYSFRSYEIAVIHGVVMFPGPRGTPPRPCFYVIYPDSFEDFVPISEEGQTCVIGSFDALSAIAGHKGLVGEGL